jgi:hypothetical protein
MTDEKSSAEMMWDKFDALAQEAKSLGVNSLYVICYNDPFETSEEVLYQSVGGMTKCLGMAQFALAREQRRLAAYVEECHDGEDDE